MRRHYTELPCAHCEIRAVWEESRGRKRCERSNHEAMVKNIDEALNSRKKLIVGFAIIAILGPDVVLGDFSGPDFALVGIRGVLDAVHDLGFERLPLFDKLRDALGVHVFHARQALNIPGLTAAFKADALMN